MWIKSSISLDDGGKCLTSAMEDPSVSNIQFAT